MADIVKRWVCGWNMPGYLPEMDPMECETWEAARDALLFELERYETDDESEMGEIDAAIAFFSAAAQQGRGCSYSVGRYAYFIVEHV